MSNTLDYAELKYTLTKDRARQRGVEFSLDVSDIEDLLKERQCYYTGSTLSDSTKRFNPAKRTIDRVDSKGGYTRDNVVASTWSANQLKNMIFEAPSGEYRMTPEGFFSFVLRLGECGIIDFSDKRVIQGLRTQVINKNMAIKKMKKRTQNTQESTHRQKMIIKALRAHVGEEIFFNLIDEVDQRLLANNKD